MWLYKCICNLWTLGVAPASLYVRSSGRTSQKGLFLGGNVFCWKRKMLPADWTPGPKLTRRPPARPAPTTPTSQQKGSLGANWEPFAILARVLSRNGPCLLCRRWPPVPRPPRWLCRYVTALAESSVFPLPMGCGLFPLVSGPVA
jgi:hypothetical protein